MKKLVRYDNYSRKEIPQYPDTTFTPDSGYWGISGIIKVPNMFHDYIFLVTYGQKQTEYEFENKKYIEVKTTTGSFHHPFHLSENEIAFSHQYGNNYYLYRVYHYNMESNSGDLKIVKGPIDRNALTPTNYTCKLEAGNEI